MKREPSVIISAVVALATAIIGLLVAFNIDVTPEQRDAIIATITSAAGVMLLVGPIIRQFVYSPRSVETIQDTAYEAGVPPTQPKPDLPPPAES